MIGDPLFTGDKQRFYAYIGEKFTALNYMYEELIEKEEKEGNLTTERKFELAFEFLDQMRNLNNEVKQYYG